MLPGSLSTREPDGLDASRPYRGAFQSRDGWQDELWRGS